MPSGGRVCAAPSGLPSSYVCQQGTIGTSEQRSCSKVYETTVSYPYYEYIVDDLLTSRPPATGFNTQAVRDQLAADIAAATNGCRMPPLVQAGSAGVSFTKLGKFNGVDVFRFNPGTIECPAPLAGYTVPFTLTNGNYKVSTTDASTAPLKLYKFDVRASPRRSPQVSGSYGPGCASLGADTTCTKLSEDCPGGETTRIVNGVSITACWERREIYQCGTSQTLPGCSAPAGMALSGETCLATNSGGACTATERTHYVGTYCSQKSFFRDFIGAADPDHAARKVTVPRGDRVAIVLVAQIEDLKPEGRAQRREHPASALAGRIDVVGEADEVGNAIPEQTPATPADMEIDLRPFVFLIGHEARRKEGHSSGGIGPPAAGVGVPRACAIIESGHGGETVRRRHRDKGGCGHRDTLQRVPDQGGQKPRIAGKPSARIVPGQHRRAGMVRQGE
ncbi:conjugal transfer protein TraN [Brevundimonas sp.]|uniref:conjugal transfer protein TraN n=1 Tax=Brevundimonas sp. TaxID=1871086 RepID=UPI002897545D|nr:conjugal transfer protein TraN [Brevundimonas sp.]